MRKQTAGFSSSVSISFRRLVLLTTAIVLCGEIGDPCNSLAHAETTTQDVPEEMLQTQIATEANSPLTGLAQSANNHAQEQRRLQVTAAEVPPRLTPSIYRSVELLRLRKLLKILLPFF